MKKFLCGIHHLMKFLPTYVFLLLKWNIVIKEYIESRTLTTQSLLLLVLSILSVYFFLFALLI